MAHKILLVDDDSLNIQATRFLLEDHGYLVHTAGSGTDAIEKLRKNPHAYSLVLVDYQMKDMDGARTVSALRDITPDLYVLIYSGDSSRDALKETWRAGAVEFIDKAGDVEAFLSTIKAWCHKYDQTYRTVTECGSPSDVEKAVMTIGMVGRSKALAELARKAIIYRQKDQNVLILGDTGTGKELVARALHDPERGGFYAINCAAYKGSTELLESELFGYERGAFTGATQEKKGILEAARGGTVFFDEIHQLSLTAQAKLLRVFQERRIRRVGGSKEIGVEFRLIAAAKPDIEERAEKGDFLPDLFHRLNVLSLHIPPLRERTEDIEPLVAHFCRRYTERTGEPKTFLLRAVRQMENYGWPGNVRELEHAVYRLLTDTAGDRIGPEHLDAKFFCNTPTVKPLSLAELKSKHEQEEREHVAAMISGSRNKLQAAQRLGVSPSTLHSIMKRVGLYRAEETITE